MPATDLTRRDFFGLLRRRFVPPAPTHTSTPMPPAEETRPTSIAVTSTASPLSLPPLQQTLLDPATVEALFRDIAACATVLSVQPKHAPRTHAPAEATGSLSLEQARARLASGQVLGVQIRYRHEGHVWTDTLLRRTGGVTLVRIREADIAASVAAESAPHV